MFFYFFSFVLSVSLPGTVMDGCEKTEPAEGVLHQCPEQSPFLQKAGTVARVVTLCASA
jgi:hypothetical protein